MTRESLLEFPMEWSRALAIAAHPDDLEYGVAAAVAAWTESGREVSYLLVTRGEAGIDDMAPQKARHVRTEEERRSAAIVGVHDVRFLDHPDGVVVEGLALRRDLAREIRRMRPDLVVTGNHHETFGPGHWNSADHRAVGRAAIDAVADAGNRWIFPELLDEGFSPWTGVRHIAVAVSPNATHAFAVSDQLDRAIASLAEHREYLSVLDPRPVEEQATEIVRASTGAGSGAAQVRFEIIEGR
jgi:LmbE family N-acetylglucosaminyl deacetylase